MHLNAHTCVCVCTHVPVYVACIQPSVPACMRVCTHTCLCLHSDPASGRAQPGLSLPPRGLSHGTQHHALRQSSIIALLIDSLTLDKSLKFSAYSSARGGKNVSPLKIVKHDTNVRITCEAENRGTTTPSTWSQGSFWAKPTHKGLHCALHALAWPRCP